MKIFGREPALIIGTIGAALSVVAATNSGFMDAGQAAALTAAVAGLLIALTTRPSAPALFTGAWGAIAALFAEYGLQLSDELVGSVAGLILAVFALVSREQISPEATMVTSA